MNALAHGHHTIDVDGIPQEYEVRGVAGPVCLALTGGPGIDGGYLRLPALEERMTMVYATQVGTTEDSRLPSHPDGYTMEVYVRFVHAVVEHLGVPRVYLLGHSAGGFFAQGYALTHPDRLAGVILHSSMAHNTVELREEATARLDDLPARFPGHPGPVAVRAVWEEPLVENPTSELRTARLRKLLPAYFKDYWGREEEFAAIAESVVVHNVNGLSFDHRGRLGEMRTPTLVVVGMHDFICSPRWAEEMIAELPDATLIQLLDSGHYGHLEQPTEFTAAVAEFVGVTEKRWADTTATTT
ncbi:alpha/beta fold hydrolase [Streptomyces sp. ok210]|jgi:proline iminopeptidase|uniref:alpha/beta fold hydrolase n=1 Tax=Streptomyces sp. ok210 TaxID=1761905 RepID=UPI0008E31731|nr:alpha/beta hydrolase [Streptomyces sp. ok210]SFT22465.1 proline iminopeptidase [Streptomyces sp. ok210]